MPDRQRVPAWAGWRMQRTVAEQKRQHAHRNSPCILCGQPIDYAADIDDPMRFSVEHIIARAIRPDLTWDPSNMGPAHMRCNKGRGMRQLAPPGTTSREW